MLHSRNGPRLGFGLRDLIIAIALVAVGLSLAIPIIYFLNNQSNRYHSGASRTQTNSNLKQFALSIHGYNDNWRKLPPAFDKDQQFTNFPVSIHIHLLPYMEQDPLYKSYLAQPGASSSRMAIVHPFISPSDSTIWRNGEGVQNFAANLRLFSAKGWDAKYNMAMPPLAMEEPGSGWGLNRILDGTSNTISFATKFATCGAGGSYYAAEPNSMWAAFFGQNAALKQAHSSDPVATFQLQPKPGECLFTPLMAQSFGTGGLSVAIADGCVRMISPTMSPETWNRAMQPNDGLELGADWN